MSKFYIYIIFRPNGVPCYIGKGKGARWRMYEMGYYHNLHLERIACNAGGDLPIVKIRSGLSEVEAFETEIALIRAIGREANGGPLVNLTDGGEGVTNPSLRARDIHRKRAVLRNLSNVQREAVRTYRNTPKGHEQSIANLPSGPTGPITEQRREAIRKALTGFWEARRQAHGGKPPSLRGKSGNIKHSLAMLARNRRPA